MALQHCSNPSDLFSEIGFRGDGSLDGRVRSLLPAQFPKYARIFHPPCDRSGEILTWGELAKKASKRMHPLAQWNKISGAFPQLVQSPRVGAAPVDVLKRTLNIVGDPSQRVLFALWEGWGWRGPATGDLNTTDDEVWERPGRIYHVFTGHLSDVEAFYEILIDGQRIFQQPSIIAAANGSWALVTEVDFDSTIVGGSAEVIESLLRDGLLEAAVVSPGDDLSIEGDHVN